MKIKSLILACSLLAFTACSSLTSSTNEAAKIQNVLTNLLPPDFSGDVSISHINPYFDFGITATNVHKNDKGLWTWDSFGYDRADMFHTKGSIHLTPKKA